MLILICVAISRATTIYVQADTGEDTEIDDYDWLDFTALDDDLSDRCSISFTKIYNCLLDGDISGVAEHILEALWDSISYEIKYNSRNMLIILAIVMFGSIFSNMSGRLAAYASEGGFFVTYLVLISLLLSSFALMQDIAEAAITDIIEFIRLFIPVYTLSAGYACGDRTAAMSYEIMIFVIYICENIIMYIIFPLVRFYCIIGLVNRLNKEDFFSKTAGLMKSVSLMILKGVLGFVMGVNIIKGMISQSVDRLERSSMYKVLSALPGGSGVSTVAGILISSGSLIRNSIGIAGSLTVIIISMLPVIKLLVILISLKVVAALVQPFSDKRYSEGVDIMAQTAALMLKATMTAVLMFVISIALMGMLSS